MSVIQFPKSPALFGVATPLDAAAASSAEASASSASSSFVSSEADGLLPGTGFQAPAIFCPAADAISIFDLSITLSDAIGMAADKAVADFCELAPHVRTDFAKDRFPRDARPLLKPLVVGLFDYGGMSMLAAAIGQREHQDASFLLIPRVPQNFFMEGGHFFARGGLLFEWEGSDQLSVLSSRFRTPLELDNRLQVGQESEGALINFGSLSMNPAPVRALCADKRKCHEFFERAGIPTAPQLAFEAERMPSFKDLAVAMARFVIETDAGGIVVKPRDESLGEVVRLFRVDDLSAAAEYALALVEGEGAALVEKRIMSCPWEEDGRILDWKIRLLVPPGDLETWRVGETSLVRYQDFGDSPSVGPREPGTASLQMRSRGWDSVRKTMRSFWSSSPCWDARCASR